MPSKDSASNSRKSQHGYDNQTDLKNLILEYKENGYLTDVQCPFRMGHPEFKNDEQFYAPFLIQFPNKSRWIIYTTTSFRQDRIKSPQWDASNLKEIDSSITGAFLAYSDDCKDPEPFRKQDEKYVTQYELSAIDRIYSFSELYRAIQKEFYEGLKEEIEIDEQVDSIPTNLSPEEFMELGRKWDSDGKNFECKIAEILSYENYLRQWKRKIMPPPDNSGFSFFTKMVSTFGLCPQSVLRIVATTDKGAIGYLPSGGPPKTDVLVDVTFLDGQSRRITLSCKRSKKNQVSFHQYSADTFADVLDPENVKLRSLLKTFQLFGNECNMPEGTSEELRLELSKYRENLAQWVVAGIGGGGDPQKHIVQYVVSYQTSKNIFSVHSVEDYCARIAGKSSQFGTPFQWTYASGQRGKCIQLKAPLFD